MKLPLRDWLWLVKLFELEISARKVSQQLGISYPTVLKAFHLIRKAITAHADGRDSLLNGEVELNQTYFEDRRRNRPSHKIPVFGILERKGQVRVEILKEITAEEMLNKTVKTVRRGSVVYTDRFNGYDALMFCGYKHIRMNSGKRFTRKEVYINGVDGFWSYAKERINKFHGVSREKFPFYLKEMEFRYNHRNKPIFDKLVCYLCDLAVV